MSKALLVVSFGTSVAETREKTITAIEREVQSAFPERTFYRAWTSGYLRNRLREKGELLVDAPAEALERMLREGVTDLLVQPTHMLPGKEFNDGILKTLEQWKGHFDWIALGAPLLAEQGDVETLADILEQIFSSLVGERNLLALMGHGSSASVCNPYLQLGELLEKKGLGRFCVGTVEHCPGFAPVVQRAKLLRPDKIYLAPLMVVAGEHALHDLAGRTEDSWRSRLEREGFQQIVPLLKGLGEYPALREMYIAHARNATIL